MAWACPRSVWLGGPGRRAAKREPGSPEDGICFRLPGRPCPSGSSGTGRRRPVASLSEGAECVAAGGGGGRGGGLRRGDGTSGESRLAPGRMLSDGQGDCCPLSPPPEKLLGIELRCPARQPAFLGPATRRRSSHLAAVAGDTRARRGSVPGSPHAASPVILPAKHPQRCERAGRVNTSTRRRRRQPRPVRPPTDSKGGGREKRPLVRGHSVLRILIARDGQRARRRRPCRCHYPCASSRQSPHPPPREAGRAAEIYKARRRCYTNGPDKTCNCTARSRSKICSPVTR